MSDSNSSDSAALLWIGERLGLTGSFSITDVEAAVDRLLAANNPRGPVRLEHSSGVAVVRPRSVVEVSIDGPLYSSDVVRVRMASGAFYEVSRLSQTASKPDDYAGTDEQWALGDVEYDHYAERRDTPGWIVADGPRAAGPVTEPVETLEEAWERVSRLLHMWPFDGSDEVDGGGK